MGSKVATLNEGCLRFAEGAGYATICSGVNIESLEDQCETKVVGECT